MKKLLVALVLAGCLLSATTSMARLKYECWTYINGHPGKMIKRVADSNSEATKMATDWFRDNEYKFDYIKCK
ncbi:MAG: hypothetical protein CSA20_05240 [Deltaproteobacteria bacterium]|nr:MAG: hypothetical protein CSA20_05240 [Deltaproteobacteria bacterium]